MAIQINTLSESKNIEMFEVGHKLHPIKLPVKDISEVIPRLGDKLSHGNISTIYQVKSCSPARVFKVIPLKNFESGDEIRISRIAAGIGIAPAFHEAFLLKEKENKYVVIEMDHAGKTMSHWMEDLAEPPKTNDNHSNSANEEHTISEFERLFQEKFKTDEAEFSQFQMIEIKQKPKLSLKDAIHKMYKKPEEFYFQFFSLIKQLAENNIAYGDSHCGNIIPNHCTEKGMQLIDFDGATMEEDTNSAKMKSLKSVYNRLHFDDFTELKDLSEGSQDLIRWFKSFNEN